MATIRKFKRPSIHRRARTALAVHVEAAARFNRDVCYAPLVLFTSGLLFLLFESLPPLGTDGVAPLELFSGEWRTVGIIQWLLIAYVWKSYHDGEEQVSSLSYPVKSGPILRKSLRRHLLLVVLFAPACSIGVEMFPAIRLLLANNRTDYAAPILWAVLGILGLAIATSLNQVVSEIGQRHAFDKLLSHKSVHRHSYGHRGLREV